MTDLDACPEPTVRFWRTGQGGVAVFASDDPTAPVIHVLPGVTANDSERVERFTAWLDQQIAGRRCRRCGGTEDLKDRAMAPGMTYCAPCRSALREAEVEVARMWDKA